MTLTDWTTVWNPVPDERPCRVWLPAQRPAEIGGDRRATPDPCQPPQPVALTLSPRSAQDLPRSLPRLLADKDLRPGAHVTVDLGETASVHLTGLALLLTVLWRRVGPQGELTVTGGSPGLRAQLDSLDITPAACRAMVFGRSPDAAVAAGPVPALAQPSGLPEQPRPAVAIPAQRAANAQPSRHDEAPPARIVLSGEVGLATVPSLRTRLRELLEQRGTRTLQVDVTAVAFLNLDALRLLLDADTLLRARGGRLLLRNPNHRVQRLLATTRTGYLAHEHASTSAPVHLPHPRPRQSPQARQVATCG